MSRAYPPGSSWLRRVFGPAIDPWTYGRAAHLAVMFPLGIVYFVFLVTALAIGVSLSWTLIGPPVLLMTMYLTRWVGDAEAWAVRHLHGMELRRPPTTIERGSYRSQVWARLIDPTTWTGLVYLLVQFPVGIATFVFLVTTTTVSTVFIGLPLLLVFGNEEAVQIDLGNWWILQWPRDAWWLPLLGVALLLIEVHLVNLLSATHAWWARLMLGSRAPHITPGAALLEPASPPEGPLGDPEGPDGPSDPASAERARRLVETDLRAAEARPAVEVELPPASPCRRRGWTRRARPRSPRSLLGRPRCCG